MHEVVESFVTSVMRFLFTDTSTYCSFCLALRVLNMIFSMCYVLILLIKYIIAVNVEVKHCILCKKCLLEKKDTVVYEF